MDDLAWQFRAELHKGGTCPPEVVAAGGERDWKAWRHGMPDALVLVANGGRETDARRHALGQLYAAGLAVRRMVLVDGPVPVPHGC